MLVWYMMLMFFNQKSRKLNETLFNVFTNTLALGLVYPEQPYVDESCH